MRRLLLLATAFHNFEFILSRYENVTLFWSYCVNPTMCQDLNVHGTIYKFTEKYELYHSKNKISQPMAKIFCNA